MNKLLRKIYKYVKIMYTFKVKVLAYINKAYTLEKGIVFFKSEMLLKGKKNEITLRTDSELVNSRIKVYGNGNSIEIKKNAKLHNCEFIIKGNDNKIIIGENVFMKKLYVVMEKSNNFFDLGNQTTSSGLTEIYIKEGTSVIIGQNCLLSREIVIRTSDGHSIMNLNNERTNHSESIKIENDVWIGQRAMVMKGVAVKSNSIIAAGSLLTKKFNNSNVVIAGSPAKVIKNGVNWTRELL